MLPPFFAVLCNSLAPLHQHSLIINEAHCSILPIKAKRQAGADGSQPMAVLLNGNDSGENCRSVSGHPMKGEQVGIHLNDVEDMCSRVDPAEWFTFAPSVSRKKTNPWDYIKTTSDGTTRSADWCLTPRQLPPPSNTSPSNRSLPPSVSSSHGFRCFSVDGF